MEDEINRRFVGKEKNIERPQFKIQMI